MAKARSMTKIALVGDFSEANPVHRAIPLALDLASERLGVQLSFDWLPTDAISSESQLSPYHGIWCVPGSPYRSRDAVLLAIRFAREHCRPFLGTCGGFQHAVIEYARNVLGLFDAEHGETDSESDTLVISPLKCGLLAGPMTVNLLAGSHLRAAYKTEHVVEEYLCSYGLNPDFQASLVGGSLRLAATDENGDVRGLELEGHPFYVITLFQPERAALRGVLPPIVASFVDSAVSFS
jgi:CTP synthase (UTP-ammonia lyase)